MHGILNLEALKAKVSYFVKENCLDDILILDSEGFPIVFYSLFYVNEDKLSAELASFFSFIDINGNTPFSLNLTEAMLWHLLLVASTGLLYSLQSL